MAKQIVCGLAGIFREHHADGHNTNEGSTQTGKLIGHGVVAIAQKLLHYVRIRKTARKSSGGREANHTPPKFLPARSLPVSSPLQAKPAARAFIWCSCVGKVAVFCVMCRHVRDMSLMTSPSENSPDSVTCGQC